MQTKQVQPEMMSCMTMTSGNRRRITILERPLSFYFLAFYGVIYQFTQMGLYCSKQLETSFHQFCEKLLHITFKGTLRRRLSYGYFSFIAS